MKILKLRLENFRQFAGVQEINFGPDPHIQLIYAANGAGKTTILNAFTWCFYKKLSKDFENPEDLVNKALQRDMENGTSLTAAVQIHFQHEEVTYIARREEEIRKKDNGIEKTVLGELTLVRIAKSGETEKISNPNVAIEQMLPARLHEFFFLNGERIEHLVKPTAYEDIEDAIKTLLGLEILDRSVKHLGAVEANLRRELKKVGDVETQEILEDIDRYINTTKDIEKAVKSLKALIEAGEDERTTYGERLMGLENARALQAERAGLVREKASIEKQFKELGGELTRLVGTHGWLAFVPGLVASTKTAIDATRSRGELPTDYKEQFIVDLLERGHCICGTDLTEGSSTWVAVDSLRESGGLDGVEETASRLGGFASTFPVVHKELHESLARNAESRRSLSSRNREVDELLDEISEKLSDDEDIDIARIESNRQKVEMRLADLRGELRGERDRKKENDRLLKNRKKELTEAHQKNAAAIIAQERVAMVSEVRTALLSIYEHLRAEVREDLDASVKEVYQTILVKAYVPEITEDFQLQITDPKYGEGRVALSVGENQVLTLSFVGALAALARPRSGKGFLADIGLGSTFQGGHYPIVLDAPWGSLDTNYRKGVAAALPSLADQVIVLVSQSQGLGEVRQELIAGTTGQTVVHLLTPKSDAHEETVQLDGVDYPYISVADDGIERSEFIAVGGS